MKSVAEITALVQEWVLTQAGGIPDFMGAYLFGGITELPGDTLFPDYRDVDLIVVIRGKSRPQEENLEVDLKGVMLEVGFMGMERHSSAEILASDPSIAPNFIHTQILADPEHFLGPLQAAVITLHPQRKSVIARCNMEKERLFNALESFRQAGSVEGAWISLWDLLNNVSGLLALADLRKPTHRRSLTLLKDILSAQGRLDLHEEALEIWGSAQMSRQRVQELLNETGSLFDRALQVKRSPSPFDFKLKPHLRPYFIAASQEIIDEGNHREATYWMMVGYIVASLALMKDALEQEKAAVAAAYQCLAEEVGIGSPAARLARYQMAQRYCGKITTLADRILEQNPAIYISP